MQVLFLSTPQNQTNSDQIRRFNAGSFQLIKQNENNEHDRATTEQVVLLSNISSKRRFMQRSAV